MCEKKIQHIFLVGAKSLGAYGGYETFVNKLTEYHSGNTNIKYHVAVKKNGQGAKVPSGATMKVGGYDYHNADCFEIAIPEWLKSAQAIYYDCLALRRSIKIIKEQKIEHPIVYIMACRVGVFFRHYAQIIKGMGGKIYLNPDGHEWLRTKWSKLVRAYWKYSEKKMVFGADLIVCDSINIEKYIQKQYKVKNTIFIAYGAETKRSECSEAKFEDWLNKKNLYRGGYYLVVGRFVPENNYEVMIREFMNSQTNKDLAIITNDNPSFLSELENKLHFSRDSRIKFAGTVYDQELLKKIREESYGYIHGHEVGGTNPSLLEAMGSTKLNLLLDVSFNREVGADAALYWNKNIGNLAELINYCENADVEFLGKKAKDRIRNEYSWEYISEQYSKIWKIQ